MRAQLAGAYIEQDALILFPIDEVRLSCWVGKQWQGDACIEAWGESLAWCLHSRLPGTGMYSLGVVAGGEW